LELKIPVLWKLFQKTERGNTSSLFYEASITPISRPNKDKKKKIYEPAS
jgi:hypothetical protein